MSCGHHENFQCQLYMVHPLVLLIHPLCWMNQVLDLMMKSHCSCPRWAWRKDLDSQLFLLHQPWWRMVACLSLQHQRLSWKRLFMSLAVAMKISQNGEVRYAIFLHLQFYVAFILCTLCLTNILKIELAVCLYNLTMSTQSKGSWFTMTLQCYCQYLFCVRQMLTSIHVIFPNFWN